jgi:hypothetical protein
VHYRKENLQEKEYYQTNFHLERVRFQTWNHPVLQQEWNRIENPQEQVQEHFQNPQEQEYFQNQNHHRQEPEQRVLVLQNQNHHRQEPEQRVLVLQNQSLPKQVRVRLQTQVQDRREPQWWIQTKMPFYTILYYTIIYFA